MLNSWPEERWFVERDKDALLVVDRCPSELQGCKLRAVRLFTVRLKDRPHHVRSELRVKHMRVQLVATMESFDKLDIRR